MLLSAFTYTRDAIPAHRIVVICFKGLNVFITVPLGSVYAV